MRHAAQDPIPRLLVENCTIFSVVCPCSLVVTGSTSVSAVSENSGPITGLYLIYLLAAGRHGDFNMELELLDSNDKKHPAIHYAVSW